MVVTQLRWPLPLVLHPEIGLAHEEQPWPQSRALCDGLIDRGDDGEGEEALKPRHTFNPHLQRFYQVRIRSFTHSFIHCRKNETKWFCFLETFSSSFVRCLFHSLFFASVVPSFRFFCLLFSPHSYHSSFLRNFPFPPIIRFFTLPNIPPLSSSFPLLPAVPAAPCPAPGRAPAGTLAGCSSRLEAAAGCRGCVRRRDGQDEKGVQTEGGGAEEG